MQKLFALKEDLRVYSCQNSKIITKQEGQVVLNRSPELYNRYLLKAGHVPGDTLGQGHFCS